MTFRNLLKKNEKMNPQSAALPAAPGAVNNMATPAPAPAAPAPAAPASNPASAPNIVANIPVHTQQAAPAPAPHPVNEDDELDRIMHDVGQELKKSDTKPQKHGLLDFIHKPKPLVKTPTPRAKQQAAAAPIPAPMPVQNLPAAGPAAAVTQGQAQATKPKTKRSVPVFVIFITLCITGFLIVAAIAAYKQT
jgi:hypothetical protein